MATLRPFRAERPPTAYAARVAAVPYDVVTTTEARHLAADNPLSFLHVSRPEIDLPDGTDVYADAVYRKAAENYAALRATVPLALDGTPSLYVYRLQMDRHTHTGVAACCAVDEYDNETIRKHERTRPATEDDRTRHLLALRAHTGPVLVTYRGDDVINAAVQQVQTGTPLYDFTAVDGIVHTIWRVPATDVTPLVAAFRAVPRLYIADGHHRAASASRARAALRAHNPAPTGDEEYNFFLAVLFPAEQMQILPYNRVVTDLHGWSPQAFVDVLAQTCALQTTQTPTPVRPGDVGMYLQGQWYHLTLPPLRTAPVDLVHALDVSRLQDHVLDVLLGITDVRTDPRLDFVGGRRGTGELEALVNAGRYAVAFALYPVTVEALMTIADAQAIMPPKSSWFEPKLRDGLLSHVF